MTETRQTVFRQTKEEFEQLKNDAYEHKMNISDYLRFLIEKERKQKTNEPLQISSTLEVDLEEVNPIFRHWYE